MLTRVFVSPWYNSRQRQLWEKGWFCLRAQRFLLLEPASLLWCFHDTVHHERRVHLGTLLTFWQKPRNQENKYTDTSEHPSFFPFYVLWIPNLLDKYHSYSRWTPLWKLICRHTEVNFTILCISQSNSLDTKVRHHKSAWHQNPCCSLLGCRKPCAYSIMY